LFGFEPPSFQGFVVFPFDFCQFTNGRHYGATWVVDGPVHVSTGTHSDSSFITLAS
jgi:hypothetical protein